MNKPVRNDLNLKLLVLSFCVAMFSLNVSADTDMSAEKSWKELTKSPENQQTLRLPE